MYPKTRNKSGVVLSETRTWRGFVTILMAVGLGLTHEQQQAIIIAGVALSGLIGVFFKDGTDNKTSTSEPISEPVELDEKSDLSDIIDKGRS